MYTIKFKSSLCQHHHFFFKALTLPIFTQSIQHHIESKYTHANLGTLSIYLLHNIASPSSPCPSKNAPSSGSLPQPVPRTVLRTTPLRNQQIWPPVSHLTKYLWSWCPSEWFRIPSLDVDASVPEQHRYRSQAIASMSIKPYLFYKNDHGSFLGQRSYMRILTWGWS